MYKNYHKHDHYGNPWMVDCVVKPEEYCKRAVELGHDSVFTVNHGVTGNIFEWIEMSKKYNLKMHYGTDLPKTEAINILLSLLKIMMVLCSLTI